MSMGIIESGEYNKVAGLGGGTTVDAVEEGNMNPVTSNAVANTATIIKSYMMKDYNLISGEPSNAPAFSGTGWFNTGLKVDANKVAVVFRHQHCIDSNGKSVYPIIPWNISNDGYGNLIFKFINISDVAKECVKCRVWFHLIGKPSDLPND